jgi:hypothetical protein
MPPASVNTKPGALQMTYSIKVEDREYCGDTLKAAQAAMRRGEREVKQRADNRSANYKTANERAQSIGYRVLCRKLEDGSPPSGWRFYPVGSKYGPKITARSTHDYHAYHDLHLETEWGRSESSHYGYVCDGHVWNGGGFSIVIFLRDNGRGSEGEVLAYAVGVCEDQVAFVPLPGITREWFTVDDEVTV